MTTSRTLGLALAISLASGCATAPCPPCEVATPGEEADSPYYALPGLDHGLLQSPVNILSAETKRGQHTIQVVPLDGVTCPGNFGPSFGGQTSEAALY